MWGQIGGENKIVIARRVMKNLVNKLGADTNIGLVAYGHRREKDCEDIEIITPLAALNKAALAQQIDALNPKGMTPITGAIRKAFEAAPAGPEATTIVLFSDGLETCGGDPCQIVSKAVANNELIDVRVHVFRPGTRDEVTGGRTYTAASTNPRLFPVVAGEYDVEVRAINFKGEATQKFSGVKIAPGDTLKKIVDFGVGELAVKVTRNGKLSDATINVVAAGTKTSVASGRSYTASGATIAQGRTYTSASSNPKAFEQSPGRYRVTAKAIKGKAEKLLEVTVVSGQTTERTVDFAK